MQPIIAFQMDPLQSLNPLTDTSLFLAIEAKKRGFKLFSYLPSALSYAAESPFAKGVFFELDNNSKITSTTTDQIKLKDADYVLVRQNPPYDLRYISCLDILSTLPPTTKVLNKPETLRLYSEKSIPLLFKNLCPLTMITSTPQDIFDFLASEKKAVLKPLYGFGGLDVFYLSETDTNRDAIIHMMLDRYPYGVIVQEYLEEVTHDDRRLILINGELKSVFKRIPKANAIRANTAVGGTAIPCDISDNDLLICKELAAFLKKTEIMLCGIDMIGSKLIEVNITSPTGIPLVQDLYGLNLAVDFWDAVLEKQ
jgi:glutathione synthase